MVGLAIAALLALLGQSPVPPPPDPYGIGLPWGAGFAAVPEREVSSVEEVRAAAGVPGRYHVAAGSYDLRGSTLTIGSGVVFEGDGAGKTVLIVGPEEGRYAVEFFARELGGLKDLTIRNANPTAVPNGVLLGMWGGYPNERGFLIGVDVELGEGLPVLLNSPTDFLVRGCRFASTSMSAAPILLCGGMRFRFERNVVDWRTGRANLTQSRSSSIVDNDFRLDGAYSGPGRPETGGVELGGAVDTVFARNRVAQVGPHVSGDNDHEMVNVQNTWPEYMDAGLVVSSSKGKTALTDLRWGDDSWYDAFAPRSPRRVLYALTGASAGRWRYAEPGKADGTLLLSSPMALAAGDRVAVSSASCLRLRIEDNVVEGGSAGIVVWNGGLDSVVSGNVLIDTGPLALRSAAVKMDPPRTPRSGTDFYPLWGWVVKGNRIYNHDGWRAANLSVVATDVQNSGLPLAIDRMSVTGNSVYGRGDVRDTGVGGSDGIDIASIVETGALPGASRVGSFAFSGNSVVGGAVRTVNVAQRAGRVESDALPSILRP